MTMEKYRSHSDHTVIVWAREVEDGYEVVKGNKILGVIPANTFKKMYRKDNS